MTPQTIQSTGFSRPEYWSGEPFPSPGDLPNPGIEPQSPALQADSLSAEPPGKPNCQGFTIFLSSFILRILLPPNEDTKLDADSPNSLSYCPRKKEAGFPFKDLLSEKQINRAQTWKNDRVLRSHTTYQGRSSWCIVSIFLSSWDWGTIENHLQVLLLRESSSHFPMAFDACLLLNSGIWLFLTQISKMKLHRALTRHIPFRFTLFLNGLLHLGAPPGHWLLSQQPSCPTQELPPSIFTQLKSLYAPEM